MASSNPLSKKIGKLIYRDLNGMLSCVRASQSRRIPLVELREEHIRNLRVVLNRNAFLEALPKGGVVAELGVDCGEFSNRILNIRACFQTPRMTEFVTFLSWKSL